MYIIWLLSAIFRVLFTRHHQLGSVIVSCLPMHRCLQPSFSFSLLFPANRLFFDKLACCLHGIYDPTCNQYVENFFYLRGLLLIRTVRFKLQLPVTKYMTALHYSLSN